MKIAAAVLLFLAMTMPATAWQGQDSALGTDVMISSRSAATPGNEIRFYDENSGEYRLGEVQSVFGFGKLITVEVYDYDMGENRTFEMSK
jgi:hypothetical protein